MLHRRRVRPRVRLARRRTRRSAYRCVIAAGKSGAADAWRLRSRDRRRSARLRGELRVDHRVERDRAARGTARLALERAEHVHQRLDRRAVLGARLPADPVLRRLRRRERVARQRVQHRVVAHDRLRLRPRAVDDDERDRPRRRLAQDVLRARPRIQQDRRVAPDPPSAAASARSRPSARRRAALACGRHRLAMRAVPIGMSRSRGCWRITTRVCVGSAGAPRSSTRLGAPAAPAQATGQLDHPAGHGTSL